MSSARHARSRKSRSGVTLLALVVVLALLLAVAAAYVDDPAVLQAAVVLTAALAVAASFVAWTASQRALDRHRAESRAVQVQLAEVRRELAAVHDITLGLSAEVSWLRAQLQEYVLPVSGVPEPVYPSLHLPLVRAAFGVEPLSADPARPVPAPFEVPPTISTDRGSEGRPPRQLVDLTTQPVPQPIARPA